MNKLSCFFGYCVRGFLNRVLPTGNGSFCGVPNEFCKLINLIFMQQSWFSQRKL
ncbi:hypothetical protein Hanom_Chr12g01128681 [Helianthus anomalus]